ncbi:hypothetical protein BZA77DRAFT_348350 [Pyronema omphalodes]|nr:hypothetical protein BZA77DRAFT_348350 [Pyronema omphalodes]
MASCIKNNGIHTPTSELSHGTPHTLGPLPDTRTELCGCGWGNLQILINEANLHVWRYQIAADKLVIPQVLKMMFRKINATW